MNTEAKQTADILLDLYSAVADTRDDVIDDALFQSIVLRLQLAGAFTGTVGARGEVELNITQLLVATTLPTMWLLQRLSHETGRSAEELLFDLRTQLEAL